MWKFVHMFDTKNASLSLYIYQKSDKAKLYHFISSDSHTRSASVSMKLKKLLFFVCDGWQCRCRLEVSGSAEWRIAHSNCRNSFPVFKIGTLQLNLQCTRFLIECCKTIDDEITVFPVRKRGIEWVPCCCGPFTDMLAPLKMLNLTLHAIKMVRGCPLITSRKKRSIFNPRPLKA